MAFDEKLANSVRDITALTHSNIEEKKMFGGLCFMVNGKMCAGVESSRLMVRLDPEKTDSLMEKVGARPMDFTSKVMKGYAFVDIDVLDKKANLAFWINLAPDYNKVAKAAKKEEKIISILYKAHPLTGQLFKVGLDKLISASSCVSTSPLVRPEIFYLVISIAMNF